MAHTLGWKVFLPLSLVWLIGTAGFLVYTGKLAEREIFLKKQLDEAWAARNAEEVDKVKKQLVNERVRIEEEREAEKDGVRRRK